MWNLLEQQQESLNVYLDGRNIEFTTKQLPNRPKSVEPRLWCAVYSRLITKTASLPSVVLIKKTAHVKSNKSSMLSVSLEEQTCSREERNASPQWKSTHRLFKAFPSLCLASFPRLPLTFAASSDISANIQAVAHRVVVVCMCLRGLMKWCKKKQKQKKLPGQLWMIGWSGRKNGKKRPENDIYSFYMLF